MTTFGGLYWYEVVLLVLGIALFIVLLSALRSALAGGKSYAGMLPFFVISIAMMGYPSIESIQYENGIVTIQNDTSQIESNPNDTAARQQIEAQVEKLAPRATNAKDAAIIDRARTALLKKPVKNVSGDGGTPSSNGSNTNPVPPVNTAALRQRVSQLTNEVGSNPKNTAFRQELEEALSQLKASGSTNKLDIEAIQHGETILSRP